MNVKVMSLGNHLSEERGKKKGGTGVPNKELKSKRGLVRNKIMIEFDQL